LRIYSTEGVSPTLIFRESVGRYYILDNGIVRKMTVNECFRIMGFPKDYKRIGKTSKQYAVIGNSIAVPMIRELAKKIKDIL
jgi:DNA (cytosine-5)-methyltransferase 1